MGRAPCCEKVGLKQGRWSAEEDEILRKYVEANGEGSWRYLPQNAGRTDNEIKNYWNSYLSRRIYTIRRPLSESSSSTTAIDIVKLDCGKKKCPTARRKNNNNPQEIPSNESSQNSLESENAGKILINSSDEIETISWSSSPFFVNGESEGPYHGQDQSSIVAPFFVNGEPENEILGPYHGLDQLSMFANDNIISDDQLLSPIYNICSLNEKDNEVVINTMDREGVVDGFNHKLLTNEGNELVSWLWDNQEDMFVDYDEQIKAMATWLLS
ncbi:Myb transcription factor [Thalictrum thalictroides]|uniref:Myb transcription factor n=1 Tax=Thalictrum thalictroides TaxID=46969 RepID=A0A7J6UWI1_THATH|nr:Myb transcription factor [Thalictrum thalictroides]